jgi:two-component system response regulator RegA
MNNAQQNLLVVDDDPAFCTTLERSLQRHGFNVTTANTIADAEARLNELPPDYAIVDLKLSGKETGLDFIPVLRKRFPAIRIVMLTGYSSIPTAVEAVKRGADNYLCKPASIEEIITALNSSAEKVVSENEPLTPPSLDRMEWEHIQRVLQDNNGNISATARALGMHRRTLQRKLQKRPVKQ